MKCVEWYCQRIYAQAPFPPGGVQIREDKDSEEEIFHELAESGLRDTLECSSALEAVEAGRKRETRGREMERTGQREAEKLERQRDFFQLTEESAGTCICLNAIKMVRDRELRDEKSSVWNLNHLISLITSQTCGFRPVVSSHKGREVSCSAISKLC